MKRLALILALLALGGCSTIKGWMGSEPQGQQPAKLVAFNEAAKFIERWHASFGDSGANFFQPALTANAVYGVSAKGELTRLDRATGREIWRVSSKIPVTAGVGSGEGLVLIGSNKGEVQAYDEDGKLRWKHAVSSEVLGVPQVADGIVIVRSGDGHITALSASNGEQLWMYEHSLPALVVRNHAGVTVHRGIVYAGFAGGKLIAVKLTDGSLLWENTVSQPRGNTELERISDITSNPVISDDEVCAIAFQGRLACYEAIQGNALWSREIDSDNGLFVLKKNIFLSDSKSDVMALDKDSGSTVWKNEQLSLRSLSAPYAQDDFVVAGDHEGFLHALSRTDGRFVARIKLDGSPVDSAPVAMDQGFLVQTRSGLVYSMSIQ